MIGWLQNLRCPHIVIDRTYINMQASYQEPEELLADESFYHWYLKKDEAAIAQWDSWIAQHPGHRALADEAVNLLGQLHLQEGPVAETRVEIAYNKLQENIHIMTAGGPAARVVKLGARSWWMAAAAVVILAVAGVGILKYTGFFAPTAETQYGQIKEQRLPDGSEVTLNAHSKISYFSGWKEGTDREVWVNGEAFFHVKKTPQKSRFIVHASRFDIIVTGTRFNVVNRDGVTNVMLQEGSVTVRTADGKEIYMKPGDFVEVNEKGLGKKPANAETVIAWKDHKMNFDNTPLPEAARMIEAQYGVQVVLADSSLAAKHLNGWMTNENLDVLLAAIEMSNNVKVERNGNTITIKDLP